MEMPIEPEPTKGHAVRFVMKQKCWHGAVIVYDDAQASIHRARARPGTPLLVEVEGTSPTPEQLAVLSTIYFTLTHQFTFTCASFCDALLPHANIIMGRLELPPAA